MFQVGEFIVFGTKGVCQVEKVGPMDLDGVSKDRLYYTLRPYYSQGSTVFTPVDNDKIVMRPVLSKGEVEELLDEMDGIDVLRIANEKAREMKYKETLRTCDCRDAVKIIKTIYNRKRTRLAEGKKVTFIDDKYFKIAEDSLLGEMAISLNLSKDQAKKYVSDRMKHSN